LKTRSKLAERDGAGPIGQPRFQRPKRQVNAMHDRLAVERAAGENRIDVKWIEIARKPREIALPPSFKRAWRNCEINNDV